MIGWCRGAGCVRGRGLVNAHGVRTFVEEMEGRAQAVTAPGTLAVGRGLQVFFWRPERDTVREGVTRVTE